jgi:two-component system response regulator RegX3
MPRIAALEDDEAQARVLLDWLAAAGYRTRWYGTGRALVRDLKREQPELLLLDWEVPQMSGAEVLRWVRANLETRLPVIFITSHDAEADVVQALADGADDYLIKPLRRAELLARINAVWRRYRREDPNAASLTFGGYTLRRATREIALEGTAIGVTETEFDLAWLLFSNPGRLLSRDFLLASVRGIAGDVQTRTMDTHVSRLRRKLDLRPENGCRLVSVYGYGYRLAPAQEEIAS